MGRKARRKVYQLCAPVLLHHAGNFPDLPSRVRTILCRMSWHCSTCNLSNMAAAETCRKCQKPWYDVWRPKRKNRSQSRQKKEKQGKERKQKESDPPATPKTHTDPLFDKPWITTTPHTKLPLRTSEATPGNEKPLPLPAPPVLPPAPKANMEVSKEGLSAEEAKTLECLRGLKAQSVGLPEEMLNLLNQLEEREDTKAPVISHSHINRRNKLQGQITAAQRKMESLDQEWDSFMQGIQDRVQHHAACYTHCRNQQVEIFKAKTMELRQLQMEMAQASQELCEASHAMAIKEELPDFAAQLQELQEKAAHLAQQGAISVDESPEMMEDDTEGQQGSAEGMANKSRVRVQAFRTAGSPHKVAQTQLKPTKATTRP